MANEHIKRRLTSLIIREMQKPHKCREILKEWLKQTEIDIIKHWPGKEQLELSSIAGVMQTGTATLENSSAVSCKVKYTLTGRPSNSSPRYLPT